VNMTYTARPLAELCLFQRGLTYSKSDEVDHSSSVVLRANNVDLASNALDLSDLRFISEEVVIPPDKLVRKGSLLICTASGSKSHLGKVAYIEDDYGFAYGGFMGQITPVTGVNGRYLFHALTSPAYKEFIASLSDGANINNLKFSDLQRFEVPFFDIGEQARIVTILDEAFEGIATAKAQAEQNLRNASEVFVFHREAMLTGNASWAEAELSSLCDIKHGYAFEGEHFAAQGEHVLLTPGSFHEAGGFRERGDKTKYFTGPIPPAFVLDEGDLLVAMTEQAAGLLGSPLLVPESGRYLHNQRLGRVVTKPGVPWLNEFFFHVFNLRRVRKEIHDSGSGAKVRHTSPGKIGAVRVRYPQSIAEQRTVADHLVELDAECQRLAGAYQRKLTALTELQQSLLHQAFTGQL
jgi:type I restriction enzyme S subunit